MDPVEFNLFVVNMLSKSTWVTQHNQVNSKLVHSKQKLTAKVYMYSYV